MHFFLPIISLSLDTLLGEPRRWHPLAAFGRLAQGAEQRFNRRTRLAGAACWLALVLPPSAGAWLLAQWLGPWFAAVAGWLAVGGNSLGQHAAAVQQPLTGGNLAAARQAVSKIVSRDTAELDANGISKAAVESVLENGSDAVIASLFWLLVAGAPGVVLHRLANTLDAMWGYRTGRYRRFGWFAARADDVLNAVPARLTALLYALAGNSRDALRCWRLQARNWYSPNAGPVMAAGAGALGIRLGGNSRYHGETKQRPLLGLGRETSPADISRSLRLLAVSAWFLALSMALTGLASGLAAARAA